MTKKPCKGCNVVKPLYEYYKHSGMADGHLNYCKSCKRVESDKRRKIKLKDPQWAAKEAKRHREKSKRRKNMFPEKSAAHTACIQLRKKHKGKDLHHWSYRDEHQTSVFPLSRADHHKIHTAMQYDQERAMYRTVPDLMLLDTKEASRDYYQSILGHKIKHVND